MPRPPVTDPPTCEECSTPRPLDKWAKVRASADGWFFTRDGRAWCPEHVPSWVAGWRTRRDSAP